MLETVYKQLEKIAHGIKKDLRRKGVAIPVENKDGSISMDSYTIAKTPTGFYKILSKTGGIVVDCINLPQTAVLLANGLALGRWMDDELLKQDRQYGYHLFEEQQAKNIINRHSDWDRVDVMYTKIDVARHKKACAKRSIMNSFEKLRKTV